VDGLEAATGAACGHRTLRVEDYGKIAATFVDVLTGKAMRVAPRLDVRTRASDYAPDEKRHYFAQLRGYQLMPEEELLDVQEVRLSTPVEQIVGRPGVRTICSVCGEEIINGREVGVNGRVLCRACLGGAYYQAAGVPVGASGIVSLPAS
jgi:formylmethanofuran dehydrogenase subunit E